MSLRFVQYHFAAGLDEQALLALAWTACFDQNPIRAAMARWPNTSIDASVQRHIQGVVVD